MNDNDDDVSLLYFLTLQPKYTMESAAMFLAINFNMEKIEQEYKMNYF